MTDPVLTERVGNITTLTLNRPERKNAAMIDLGEELQARVAAPDRDADTRVIVLTATGDAFCAGDDVQAAVVCSPEFARRRGLKTDVVIAAQSLTTDPQTTFTGKDMRQVLART